MDNDAICGIRLGTARRKRGMSKSALARLMSPHGKTFHTDRCSIGRWESGAVQPGCTSIRALCSVLRVSADWLIGLSDHEPDWGG